MRNDSYLKIDEVVSRTSISRSSIYRFINSGEFPAPYRISKGRVAWRASDIDKWFKTKEGANVKPLLKQKPDSIVDKLNEVFCA